MGGDHGPSVVVPGAALALERPSRHALPDVRQRGRHRAAPRGQSEAEGRDRDPPHGRRHRAWTTSRASAIRAGRGKSSMWQAIQAVRDGEADACGLGRQHRRAHGDGQDLPQDHGAYRAPGHRRDVADAARREHRARRRRHDRGRRRPSRRHGHHGRRHGPDRLRPRPSDRRPAQRRHGGDQGHRGRQGGGPAPARGEPAEPRLIAASSRATTSARAPSTWS